MRKGALAPCPPFKHKYHQDGEHGEPVIGRRIRVDGFAQPTKVFSAGEISCAIS
jgi:hypothetical protein